MSFPIMLMLMRLLTCYWLPFKPSQLLMRLQPMLWHAFDSGIEYVLYCVKHKRHTAITLILVCQPRYYDIIYGMCVQVVYG